MLDNKGFDLWADGYDAAVGLSEEENSYPFAGYKEVLGGIFKEVMTKENAKVLDIGFGTGTLTTKLYENGCEVYGQDFSQRMIELAKEKMPDASLYQGDFSKGLVPELSNCKFDYIIGTYSLHHLTDEQKVSFFTGLLSQLNEDGKLLIGDVAFKTRVELENCKSEAGDEWDEDEIYFVIDEIKKSFPQTQFEQKSYCSGIITIKNSEARQI
ncbi:putative AdoMet-dependent methyltransferase [Butyrivibrio proteoclasticus]|uniref:Putative AdoMet-dependent methyltransferase n=1 Tax=Butyrivibrio proteoclasticus TaxID=43305 RepID=A0A1I5YMN3_9FIRM|nr:class I SAM-dependent methyltransferase [Butyrivibrio proteoclasticus]SFQ45380.1 putative AdoMet-dependent methyltransferase [Butyrivibrio proteoclasticus]